MNDDFLLKYSDLYKVEKVLKDSIDALIINIDSCSNAINALIDEETFSGKTATSIKDYLNDVHMTLLKSLRSAAQNLQDNFAAYKLDYYSVDNSTSFILDKIVIDAYQGKMEEQLKGVLQTSPIINSALDEINGIFPCKKPSTADISSSHEDVNTTIQTLLENVETVENQTVTSIQNSTEPLVTLIKSNLSSAGKPASEIETYLPNAFFMNVSACYMCDISQACDKGHEQSSSELDQFWAVEEQKAKEADEKKTKGIWKTASSIGLIVGGGVCIFFTAGAATPIVVYGGAVAGGGTVVFGLSDAAEGTEEIVNGINGDRDSTATNPIRDNLFAGNEKAYQITENAFAFTSSAMVPISAASKAGTLTSRSAAVAVGKLAISDGAGAVTSKTTTKLTGNQAWGTLAGMGASTLTGFGLNALDSTFSISNGRPKTTQQLLQETHCSKDELYRYLLHDKGADVAEDFIKNGTWPDEVQIPKDPAFINADGSQNWSSAPENGYTLTDNGKAIKSELTLNNGDYFDRYGSSNGRYVSPLEKNQSFGYSERSLPYVEDARQYHRYKVTGDFSKLADYIDKCPDQNVVDNVNKTIELYYKGDYSNLVNYKGTAARVEGWGTGGATQWELGLSVDTLQKLGIIEEIPVPPNMVNTTSLSNIIGKAPIDSSIFINESMENK